MVLEGTSQRPSAVCPWSLTPEKWRIKFLGKLLDCFRSREGFRGYSSRGPMKRPLDSP